MGEPIVRYRPGSPRGAFLYAASQGEPPKRSVVGHHGKIEVLGAGQQLVVYGLHPSGAPLVWARGRGPDTVARGDLPVVTEEQLGSFLTACAPLLGSIPELPAMRGKLASANGIAMNWEMAAGIEPCLWFDTLPPDAKHSVIKTCLAAIDNTRDDPRDRWFRLLFAVGDAEHRGCPNARQLALEWSKRGKGWTGDQDFETVWSSWEPRQNGVTVGTLIYLGEQAGANLKALMHPPLVNGQAIGSQAPPPSSAAPQTSPIAISVAQLPAIPRKRQWLHGTDLARGAVSLMVAQGGRGKSSWLITLSLACASGKPMLDSHVFGGPLSVLLLNCEDATNELALRLRAAMQHHGLKDADLPHLHVAGADKHNLALLKGSGNTVGLDEAGWALLEAELERLKPDVLILDPLVSLLGGVSPNDNAAAALLMSRFVALAAKRRMAIMIAHHAAKGRDPTSAESAMGAASFTNLSRIVLSVEPLAEAEAGRCGLPPWDARFVFVSSAPSRILLVLTRRTGGSV